MKTKLSSPSKKHKERWSRAQEIGCVACLLDGRLGVPGDVHHILSGGRRISHYHSLILCPWHHRAVPLEGGMCYTEGILGPSMAHSPREFKRRYGTDSELLEIQNALLDKHEEMVQS